MDYDDSDSDNAPPTTTAVAPDEPGEDTLRVMISTDNHLGYSERDPVRGMDSFAAFEEVLYLAKRFHCDMVLLAGDLFHHNKPSRPTLYKTMDIIRRYCLGDNPVKIQVISDQEKNFASGVVNYQDPNYSVDLPIFSIHGNHDDPVRDASGATALAALDLLSVSNMVNYIGKQNKIDQVEISPVLLKKGETKVALYGLGSMRDERLNRMWNGKKVRFLRPAEDVSQNDDEDDNDEEGRSGFFNMFTLHQNRDLGRGNKNCIQESMIPEWMDAVIWGHEHEQAIGFAESVVGTFRISQPGSSVATSLVAGEAARKKVGILDINGRKFRLRPIPLTQVRSFVTTDLSLRESREELDPDDPHIEEKIATVLEEQVRVLTVNARERREEVLSEAISLGSDAGEEESPLKFKLEKPHEVLVRIRVDHSGFSTLNNQRFGARFVGAVANPEDILLFHRKKDHGSVGGKKHSKIKGMAPVPPEQLEGSNVEDLVHEFLQENQDSKLSLLSERSLREALTEYVDKSVAASIDDTADSILSKRQKALLSGANMAKASDKASEQDDEDRAEEDSLEHAIRPGQKQKQERSTSQGKSKQSTGKENLTLDSGDEMDANVPSKRQNSRTTSRSSMGDDEMDFEDAEPANRSSAAKPAPRSKNGDPKRKAARRERLTTYSDSDDDFGKELAEKQTSVRGKRASRSARVNYSNQDDPIELDSDSDEEIFVEPPSRKRSKTSASSRSRSSTLKKAPSAAKRAPRSSRKRFDDSDDEVLNNSIDLDDDWGTANTRSHV